MVKFKQLTVITNMRRLKSLRFTPVKQFNNVHAAVFGISFAAIGTVFLFTSHAATPTASIEPENGTLASCATAGSDSNASGGHFVRFTNCAGQTTIASSVSQYGITWTFDSPKTVGQFANGDYWVVGPVTITSMSPAFDNTTKSNGWDVNPTDTNEQPFDGDAYDYNQALMPSLPYAATANESIVKAVSVAVPKGDCKSDGSCVQKAAVLTVLGSVPANNGTTVFRPSYFGTSANKSLLSTTDMDAHLGELPRLSSTTAIDAKLPTLANAYDDVKRVAMVHKDEWAGTSIKPRDSFRGMVKPYGPGVSNINADSFLRMLTVKPGDSETERRQVAIALTQYGIDIYGMIQGGAIFKGDGGNNLGYRLPMAWSGYILNNATIKAKLASAPTCAFPETDVLIPSGGDSGGDTDPRNNCDYFKARKNISGRALWGQRRGDENGYWAALAANNDSSNILDPYGIIDGGGMTGTGYQNCCNSSALKASALVVGLIPGLRSVYNNEAQLEYADRWVNFGVWAQPDPCAPPSQGGGPNPSKPGECKLDPDLAPGSTFTNYTCQAGKQCGRSPAAHGTDKNEASWESDLAEAAWPVYRSHW
jgi:hypothetical protein